MSKLGIQDLASVLSQKRGLTKAQAESFVSALFDVVNYGLDTERQVKIKGFGTFKVTNVKDRESINVNTGERVVISGHGKITFTPDAILRDMVNKPFSQFETVVLNEGVDFSELDAQVDKTEMGEDDELSTPNSQVDKQADGVVAEAPQTATDEHHDNTSEGVNVVKPAAQSSTQVQSKQADSHPITQQMEDEAVTHLEDTKEHFVSVPADNFQGATTDETAPKAEPATDQQLVSDGPTPTASSVTPESSIHGLSAKEEEQTEEEEEETENKSNAWKPIITGVLFIALAAAAGFVGFYLGARSSSPVSETVSPQPAPRKKVVRKVVQPKTKVDTVKTTSEVGVSTTAADDARKALKASPVSANEKPTTPARKEKKPAANEVESRAVDTEKYDRMDVRVRTGAYSIVGVSKTVTARSGETLKSISDRNLGPGMECYVEVVNGKKTIKEGDRVKIPELKLKKRLRR